jgi:protein-disulfide isomerase
VNMPRSWRSVFDTLAAVAMLVAAATVIWTNWPRGRSQPALPRAPVPVTDSPRWGDPNARIAILLYSDFQCPFCAKFATETLPQLKKEFVDTGVAVLVFRHFPLEKIHQFAFRAAVAADCADRQGKFGDYHDVLFRHPKELDDDSLKKWAVDADLNLKLFTDCLGGPTPTRIADDVASGRALEVSGTPTFFVGTIETDGRIMVKRRLSGAVPLSDVREAIEATSAVNDHRLPLIVGCVVIATLLGVAVRFERRRRQERGGRV